MKTKAAKWIGLMMTIFLIFSFIFSPAQMVTAQDSRPEKPFTPEQPHEEMLGRPYQAEDGSWYISDAPLTAGGGELRALRDTGGPDDFGYTWDDSVTFEWVDAKTNGTNINLYGGDVYTYEPVNIGFSFPFYGSQYNDLYITTKGLVSFLSGGLWYNSMPIPQQMEPNNFIGVLWSDLGMYSGNRPDAGIYVLQGGEAPHRYFVIEWHRADAYFGEGSSGSGNLDLTFQIILHEDGDIVMQYHTVNSYPWQYSIGIEDQTGDDGLQYLYNEPGLSNGLAIRYTYPDPSYRVSLTPRYQGSFVGIGESETFEVILRNNGDLGTDSYNLTSNSIWKVDFFEDDGETPIVNSVALAQGEQKVILAQVTAPPTAQKGAEDKITITATSVIDDTKSRTSSIDAAIPAPFAQTYSNDYYSVQTQLNWPDAQLDVPVKSSWEYMWEFMDSPAIVETPGHNFVHVWREWDYQSDQRQGYVLKFAVVDQLGQKVRPTTALSTLFTGGTGYHHTEDMNHAIAVAPDGKVGVIWTRMIRRHSDNKYNYNVWFAVLNPTGSIAYAPVQITNNSTFSNYTSGYNVFGNTRIAASEDNRFMLTWTRTYQSPSSTNASILTMVRTSGGAPVTGINNITGSVNNIQFGNVILTALTGNRHFLTYWRLEPMGMGYTINPKYRVFNSAGTQVVSEQDYSHYPFIEDAIQTTNGDIFMAIRVLTGVDQIGFTILDGDDYSLKIESLSEISMHPSATGYYGSSLSVTQDQDGNAIMTWMDRDGKHLYYALIAPDGSLLSGPSIFHDAQYSNINTNGYAITTNSWAPTSDVDLMVEFSSSVFRAMPGESAEVKVRFANLGFSTATGVDIHLNLMDGLKYTDSLYNPYIESVTVILETDITFGLYDLNFGDGGEITVFVEIPADAELGTFFDLDLEITSTEADADLTNNSDTGQVSTSVMLYLPLIIR